MTEGPPHVTGDAAARSGPPRPMLGLVDAAGRLVGVSAGLAGLLGPGRGALVGRPAGQLFDRASRAAVDDAWRRACEHTTAVSCLAVLDRGHQRGSPVEVRVEVRVEPLSDADGGLVALVLHDVAAADRADREARLLRRVTEAANDTSATSALFERAMRDIATTMDWTPVAVVPVDDAVPDGPDVTDVARRAMQTGTPTSSDDAATGRVAVPVVAGEEVTSVLVLRSEHPTPLDAELTSLLMAVGRQLGSVVDRERMLAVLDQRSSELERSNSELERFAYVASHDLQEPLRKIVGFSELLEQQLGDQLPDPGSEYLGYVVDGARRMQRLIKDLLAFSRAGRARPVFEQVDLGQVVAEVVDTLEFTLADAGADVVVDPPPPVWGDPDQLRAILVNLLSNAVKYHPGGAHVVVAGRRVPDTREVEVTVADDGIGIAPEYRGQIFEVFRRLHGPTEYPGTGIGLSITERFVHGHGGRIWVTDNQPRGSVFHVTLPAAPPKEPVP